MKCLKNENQNLVEIIRNFDSRTCYESIQRYRSGGYLIFKDGGKPKIHIKKKNRGKFTDYCGGKVTDSCIRRAKASGNPTLVKRATFAANARKWKHAKGGILYGSEGMDLGYDMNQEIGMDFGTNPNLKKNKTAPVDSKGDQKEAYDWFKQRYSNVNWNNMNYIYNQFKRAGIPYDTAIAVMGNIVHESQGDPRRRQVGGGPGYGLLQWNKGTEPGDTLVAQTRGIISALKNPASQSNYWYHGGAGSGFRTGADAQKYIMSKNNYNFTNKTKVFSSSYLRPGKPHLEDRIKSSRLLARLYKEYNKGGIL